MKKQPSALAMILIDDMNRMFEQLEAAAEAPHLTACDMETLRSLMRKTGKSEDQIADIVKRLEACEEIKNEEIA